MRRCIFIKSVLIIFICLFNVAYLSSNVHIDRWLYPYGYTFTLYKISNDQNYASLEDYFTKKEADKLFLIVKNHKKKIEIDSDRAVDIFSQLDSIINSKVSSNEIRSLSQLYKAIVLDNIYQSGRYKYNNRTQVADYKLKSVDEWSANTFCDSIFDAIRLSLAYIEKRPMTSINDLDSLKTVFTIDDNYISTIRDLVYSDSNNLLSKYKRNNLNDIKEVISMKDFIDYDIKAVDRIDSLIYVNLQKQMRLYQKNSDTDRLLYNELKRIDFINSMNYDTNQLYKDIIADYSDYYKNNKSFSIQSNLVIKALNYIINEEYHYYNNTNEKESKKEIDIILLNINRIINNIDPSNPYISNLINIKNLILNKEIMLEYDEINNSTSDINIELKYRNIDNVIINLYNGKSLLFTNNYHLEQNYILETTKIKLPKQKYGDYSIEIISPGCDTINKNLKVTDLMPLVQRGNYGVNKLVVVDRTTGYPIKGAKVELFIDSKDQDIDSLNDYILTDNNGVYKFPDVRDQIVKYKVSYKDDKYYERSTISHYRSFQENQNDKISYQNHIFTDRDIFRPGQTIYFKVISTYKDQHNEKVIPNNKVEILLYDFNRKLVEKKDLTTDQYGALAGEFKLPNTGLSGNYYINILSENAKKEYKSIFVQEYKRNALNVEISPIEKQYIYGDTIPINGNISTDFGAKLSDVAIKYTLYKNRFNNREIFSHGEVFTDSEGHFNFDININKQRENSKYYIYDSYIVEIEAIAPNGEVVSKSKPINIAEKSLNIRFKTDSVYNTVYSSDYENSYFDKDKSKSFMLSIENLDNCAQNVKAELDIVKVDINGSDSTFTSIKQLGITSGQFFELDLSKFKGGLYEFRFLIKDEKGRVNNYTHKSVLYSLNDKKLSHKNDLIFITESNEIINNQIEFYIGTYFKNVSVLIDVFCDGENIMTERIKLSNELKRLKLKLNEYNSEEILVNVSFVKDQKLYYYTEYYELTEKQNFILVKPVFFRDKVTPGDIEVCEFELKNSNGKEINAQVMASMYDASLDKIYNSESWNIYQANNNRYYIYWEYKYYQRNSSRRVINEKSNINTDFNVVVGYAPVEQEEMVKAENLSLRSNFKETAFFYPKLTTEQGKIKFSYKVPDALTKWQFRLLAHNEDFSNGSFTKSIITSKELSASLNTPTFVRNGDEIDLMIMMNNYSYKNQKCLLSLEITNAIGNQILYKDSAYVSLKTNENKVHSFRFTVPSGIDLLTLKAVLNGDNMSDGEKKTLSVLPSETLITKSGIINVKEIGDKEFTFEEFANNYDSVNRNISYKLEFTSNPSWLALMSINTSNIEESLNSLDDAIYVYYLNTVLKNIAANNPEIIEFIDKYKISENIKADSPLELNQEMKQFIISETPWLNDAIAESDNINSLRNILDINNIVYQLKRSLDVIKELQNKDGGLSWYKESNNSNLFQTLLFLRQMENLKDMTGTDFSDNGLRQVIYDAIIYADREIIKRNSKNKEIINKGKYPGYEAILWSYIRVLNQDIPFTDNSITIHKEYIAYMRDNYKKLSLKEKALAAITLRELGFNKEADNIVNQIKSLSVSTEDMGRYWPNNKSDLFISSLSTHVLLMNTLLKNGATASEIDDMKVWLLKNKQTNMWRAKSIFIDAICGLLLLDTKTVSDKVSSEVKVGPFKISSSYYLGYSDTVFYNNSITKDLSNINIRHYSDQFAFGAVYWQSFIDFDKVKDSGKELKIRKELYKKVIVENNKTVLIPVDSEINIGDIITTRFVITADRDFEFVSLIDNRAACFETFDKLSGYKNIYGKSFYMDNKDYKTDMFFDRIPKGSHVIEYDIVTTQRGIFRDGISTIQSIYSPEFVGNTSAGSIKVKNNTSDKPL